MKKTGVVIARFQTPYLHEGHIDLINNVSAQHSKVIIILGVSPLSGSRRNPYDYHTREKMIKKQFPELVVLPLSDLPSDISWSDSLDNLLINTFPTEQFQLYGSRDSFISYYTGRFVTEELPQHGDYNATDLRARYADKVLDSTDFRSGILYAYHIQYKKVYPTVDIAVFRNDKKEILLGKKPNSPLWRLPGGFVDPEDENYESAARRELTEETGAIEVSEMTYETSLKVDDWRYRQETDKILTLLFSCDHIYGVEQASDDLIALDWFTLEELTKIIDQKEVTKEHIPLFNHLLKKYA